MKYFKLFPLLILSILFFFFYTDNAFAVGDPISPWTLNSIALPHILSGHASTGNGNKIFIIGGTTFSGFDEVYSADTNSDGSVSLWGLKHNLPENRYVAAKAEKDGRVYIMGGLLYNGSPQFENTVYFSTFQVDGNNTLWQTTSSLPQSLVESESVIVGNWIYFAGGTNNSGTSDVIYMASINLNGTLNAWVPISHLPIPLKTFGMVTYQNKIYVIGGNSNGSIRTEVYSSDVDPATGGLSAWHLENSLTHQFADLNQTILVGNTIFVVGGTDGSSPQSRVLYSTVEPDGSLSAWQQSANSLPQPVNGGALVYLNGYLYLTGGNNGVGIGHISTVYYSKVSDGTLAVPLLKQTSSPWGSQDYDSANVWASLNPSIGRWGCALTSAVMVFKYFGINKMPLGVIDLDPGTVNTWLKSQVDGYVGNGLVNWLALSRLSKQSASYNSSFVGDALEFSRRAPTNSQLASDLTNNIPDILDVVGHFVVATGTSGATFKINDPFYPRTDLTSYDGIFKSLNRFKPEFTDLSYIMVAADPAVDLDLQTELGSEVGESFEQDPIVAPDGSGQVSGNPVKILYFEKPTDGKYKLNIASGIGKSYNVKIYQYDENGNVKLVTNSGIVGPGDTDSYLIQFNKSNSGDSISNQQVTFQSLMDDLNSLCRLGDINKNKCNPLQAQARAASSANKNAVSALLKVMDREIANNKGGEISNNAYNILHSDILSLLASI